MSSYFPSRGFNARAVHLIDGENLLKGGPVEPSAVTVLWGCYQRFVPATGYDQYFMGASLTFANPAVAALPVHGVRLVVSASQEWPQAALIDSVDVDHLARRFGRLVIASADGKFAGLARAARERGIYVHVVATGPVSRKLRAEANTCCHLKLGLDRHDRADELSSRRAEVFDGRLVA
jgi:hypothetical protein